MILPAPPVQLNRMMKSPPELTEGDAVFFEESAMLGQFGGGAGVPARVMVRAEDLGDRDPGRQDQPASTGKPVAASQP
jgi:hypothetical protein